MNPEFTIQQIEAFVAKGFPSVAARMTKALLQHFNEAKEKAQAWDDFIKTANRVNDTSFRDFDDCEEVRMKVIDTAVDEAVKNDVLIYEKKYVREGSFVAVERHELLKGKWKD